MSLQNILLDTKPNQQGIYDAQLHSCQIYKTPTLLTDAVNLLALNNAVTAPNITPLTLNPPFPTGGTISDYQSVVINTVTNQLYYPLYPIRYITKILPVNNNYQNAFTIEDGASQQYPESEWVVGIGSFNNDIVLPIPSATNAQQNANATYRLRIYATPNPPSTIPVWQYQYYANGNAGTSEQITFIMIHRSLGITDTNYD